MTQVVLVPIKLDAFYTDGTAKLAAPLADFTSLPYYYYSSQSQSGGGGQGSEGTSDALKPPPPPPSHCGVNDNYTFLGNHVFRALSRDYSGQNDTWMPPKGIHLHWALPDALTSQRIDPQSNGKPRFPQVPNRWLVVISTKTGDTWTQRQSQVIESDYLYPDPKANPQSCSPTAISFPIAPPEAFQEILEASVVPDIDNPTQDDLTNYPFLFKAPFRCMGRQEELQTWQSDTNQNEYLPEYNPAGLTAVGYGHPLFAAIYSNCYSVFGFHDDLTTPEYPRRYDLIGWYDDPNTDCLSFFQNVASGISPEDALKAEYDWVLTPPGEDFPSVSAYYSRLEIDSSLTGDIPSAQTTVTVGNTATEALSAYLSQSLQPDGTDQIVVEEQLEAISLQSKISGENIDLGAKFAQARHDKGFKSTYGGNLWSVRSKSTNTTVSSPDQNQNGQITLPDGLAHLLNTLNILQQGYDNSRNEIDSLRKRVFADWYRFEYQEADPSPLLPSQDDILNYSQNSALLPLQERIAATGEVAFTTDDSGNVQITVADNDYQYNLAAQYTLAQQLVDAVTDLRTQLGAYNQGQAAQQAGVEYYLIRKEAPRFYRTIDPAVLLDGDAVVVTDRHGADGTLSCTICSVTDESTSLSDSLRTNGVSGGAFSTILASIEALSQQSGGQGFKNQSEQPWNPISLEWFAQVWPEQHIKKNTGTSLSSEGFQFNPDYLTGTYEFDVDSVNLLLTKQPYGLANPEDVCYYSGRAILVSHAPEGMQNFIQAYLMPLTLFDLKIWGLRNQHITDETDYTYDLKLFSWANTTFGIPNPPFLATLQDPSTLTPSLLAQQQYEITAWMQQQYPFVTVVNNEPTLIDLVSFLQNNPSWEDSRPIINDAPALDVFSNLSTSEQVQDPVRTAVQAYTTLSGKELLSQALSGFNDALLTQEREFQLPVWDYRVVDPALENRRAFARDIGKCIGSIRTAPVSTGAFLPIRSGIMQISVLILVDSFGQYLLLTYGGAEAVKKSERMTILNNVAASGQVSPEENEEYIYLSPGPTQECRLNFRWFAASQGNAYGIGDETEMNDHPASTPICGWILPNNLDMSLAVYASNGTALGSLVQSSDADGNFSVAWESAPDTNNYTPLSKLSNPHLYDFVSNIMKWVSTDNNKWQTFLSNINAALQNIDPKSFAQHESLALLMGRPLALVRAGLSVETKGLPDVDHSDAAFTYNQTNNLYTRLTRGFDTVQIPVRLGEAGQLNDGLVAYWVEDGQGGYIDGVAHFPELEAMGQTADALSCTLSGDTTKITMLLDPRGTVHATTGVLPVKQISIPPDQYAHVLKTLSVTFLTSPVITPLEQVQIPLPAEAGYGWSWLDRSTGFTWNRVADIKNPSREAKYEKQRILEGWLKLTPETLKKLS